MPRGKLTSAEYERCFKRIAEAVFDMLKPHYPDAREHPDVWGNAACQIAENAIGEVCEANDVELPDLSASVDA